VGEGAVDFVKCAQMQTKLSGIIFREFGVKCEIDFTHSETADIEFDETIQRQIRAFTSRNFSDSDAPPTKAAQQAAEKNGVKVTSEGSATVEYTANIPKNAKTTLLNEVKDAYFDENGFLHVGFLVLDVNEPRVIYGKSFNIHPLTIASLTRSMSSITVAGEVFGLTLKEMKKKGNFSVSFGFTDKNGSVTVKKIVSEERGEQELLKLKDSMVLAIEGKYAFDEFENENVITPYATMEIKKKLQKLCEMATTSQEIQPGETKTDFCGLWAEATTLLNVQDIALEPSK
jgi:DNA polymerase III alpha subunit (gram-positive type)